MCDSHPAGCSCGSLLHTAMAEASACASAPGMQAVTHCLAHAGDRAAEGGSEAGSYDGHCAEPVAGHF